MPTDPRTELSNQLAIALTNRSVEPDERREITITFRVSAAEKQRLEQRCSGVVQSDYIRSRLFDYPLPHPKQVIPEVNRQVIYELKKIGNNLNQQTRAINEAVKIGSQPLSSSVKGYLETIKELVALLEKTRQYFTQPIQAEGATKKLSIVGQPLNPTTVECLDVNADSGCPTMDRLTSGQQDDYKNQSE